MHRALMILAIAFSPAAAAAQAACDRLESLTERMNAWGGVEMVQDIRSIYTIHGLAFGGEQTAPKCRAALADLRDMRDTFEREGMRPLNCVTTDRRIARVREELDRTGADRAGLDALLADTGVGPGPSDSRPACQAANAALETLLTDLRAMPDDTLRSVDTGFALEMPPTLEVSGFAATLPGAIVTYWESAGATYGVEMGRNDGRVRIWLWDPTDAMTAAGLTRGSLVMDGFEDGPGLTGSLWDLAGACGIVRVPVTGQMIADVELNFEADVPIFDEACTMTEITARSVSFDFAALAPEGFEPDGAPVPFGEVPGFGVWAARYGLQGIGGGLSLSLFAEAGAGGGIVGAIPGDAKDILVYGQGCTPDLDQMAFQEADAEGKAAMLRDRWCLVTWQDQYGWIDARFLSPGG